MLSRLSYPDRLKILNYLFLFIFTLFSLEGYVLFMSAKNDNFLLAPLAAESQTVEFLEGGENQIVGNNFSLEPLSIEISIIDLKKELEFQKNDKRPDVTGSSSSQITCIIKKNFETRDCIPNKRIYLTNKNGLSFSSEPTDFWFDSQFSSSDEMKVNVGVDLPENVKLAEGQRLSFSVQPKDMAFSSSSTSPQFIQSLSNAKWWGQDLLLSGERIEIGKEPSYICNLSPNKKDDDSFLFFNEEKWQVGTLEDAKDMPIARIKNKDPKKLELEAWDANGDNKFITTLTLEDQLPFVSRGEDLLNAMHLRTKKQISCLCGKQRLLLREKDYVTLKDGKWRRTSVYKKHEGDLFCLDSIQIDEKGQKVVVGSLYNTNHTAKKILSKPIVKKLPVIGGAIKSNNVEQREKMVKRKVRPRE